MVKDLSLPTRASRSVFHRCKDFVIGFYILCAPRFGTKYFFRFPPFRSWDSNSNNQMRSRWAQSWSQCHSQGWHTTLLRCPESHPHLWAWSDLERADCLRWLKHSSARCHCPAPLRYVVPDSLLGTSASVLATQAVGAGAKMRWELDT